MPPHPRILAVLDTVPLLSQMTHDEKNHLASLLVPLAAAPGTAIVVEGGPPDGFYIVAEGELSVTRAARAPTHARKVSSGGKSALVMTSDPRDTALSSALASHPSPQLPPIEVGVLRAGDFFGEASLLTDAPRSATVTVSSEAVAVLLRLDREAFHSVFAQERTHTLPFEAGKGVDAAVSSESTVIALEAIAGTVMTTTRAASPRPPPRLFFPKRPAITSAAPPRRAPAAPSSAVRAKTPAQLALLEAACLSCALFRPLPPGVRAAAVAEMHRVPFPAGDVAVQQGDEGDLVFAVETGSFAVTVDGCRVGTRGPGSLFGELALLYNTPRMATVTAETDAVAWALDRFVFRRIVTNLSVQRLAEYTLFLRRVPLLAPLTERERGKLAEALAEVSVQAGRLVFKQGSAGECMYVVYEGTLTVTKKGKGDSTESTDELVVNTVTAGGYFGERSLLSRTPRAATVTAVTDCRLLRLDRAAFALLLGPLEELMRRKAAEDDHAEAAAVVGGVMLPQQQQQQEPVEHHFFLPEQEPPPELQRKGRVAVPPPEPNSVLYPTPAPVPAPDRAVSSGETVSEVSAALPVADPSTSAATAAAAAAAAAAATASGARPPLRKGFTLPRAPSTALTGPSSKPHAGSHVAPEGTQEGTTEPEETPASSGQHARTSPPLSSLVQCGVLGCGSYGFVTLVRHPPSGATFALKALSKTRIVDGGLAAHVVEERRVLASLSPHPCLLGYHGSARDRDCLYLLLEPALGGELFTLLRALRTLSEGVARYYTAAVALALAELHKRGIVYRDLKPENVLLTREGRPKLSDYGFAKHLAAGEKTWTLCGTPDYLSPESLGGVGHDGGVDWWGLGVLAYELMASYPPFYDENTLKTYEKILAGDYAIPPHFSPAASTFVRDLLQQKPTQRLGVVLGGAQSVLEHHFFHGVDWQGLSTGTGSVPYVPTVAGDDDLTNFAPVRADDGVFEPYLGPELEWAAEF